MHDEDQRVPIASDDPAVASMAEPVSIAVGRRSVRGSLPASASWSGAGPMASASASSRSSVAPRCRRSICSSYGWRWACELGAETLAWTTADEVVAGARRWAGPAGPPVGR